MRCSTVLNYNPKTLPVMPELEEVRLEQFDTVDGDFGSCAGITAGHDFGVLCGYSVICNSLASNFFPFSGNLRLCRHSSQRFGTCNARCRNQWTRSVDIWKVVLQSLQR